MDEVEIQQKRRDNEEQATMDRARILGLPYLDTREFEQTVPLAEKFIPVEQMHRDFIIPFPPPLWPGQGILTEAMNTRHRWFIMAVTVT
jgi:hypothetical protein